MHSQATEFQSVCGYLLWENEGGLSLEAGAGDHPQQSPTSLIQSVHKPALEPRGQAAFLHHHASICGGQISLGLGRQDTLYAQGLAPNIRWLLVLCQVREDTVSLTMCVLGPAALLRGGKGLAVSALWQGGVCKK